MERKSRYRSSTQVRRNRLNTFRRTTGTLVFLVVVPVLAVLAIVEQTAAHNIPVPPAPAPTQSYYVQTKSTSYFYDKGRSDATYHLSNGPVDGVITFMFGRPAIQGGLPGAIMYNDAFISTDEIYYALMNYAGGWWFATSSYTPRVTIVVGTSNYGLVSNDGALSHGVAWGQLANRIDNSLYRNGWTRQINVAGGTDMEIGWSSPGVARKWLDGYNAGSYRILYDFGDAAGCYPYQPGLSNPSICDNGWSRNNVWYKATGCPLCKSIPQIYFTRNGLDPKQAGVWQKISLYAYLTYGRNIPFAGVVTQRRACIDRGSPARCYNNGNPSTGEFTNTPAEGWTQLQNKLYNNDPPNHSPTCLSPSQGCHRTDYAMFGWASDFTWNFR
jgi:hypothetical protein